MIAYYDAQGETPNQQIKDAVDEATAFGSRLVVDIFGLTLSIWPRDDARMISRDYKELTGKDPSIAPPSTTFFI